MGYTHQHIKSSTYILLCEESLTIKGINEITKKGDEQYGKQSNDL